VVHLQSRGRMLSLRRRAGGCQALWWVAFAASIPACAYGFYLPGVAPTDYVKGEELNPKVEFCWEQFFEFDLGHIVNMPLFFAIRRWKH
jgi:hypothetical protein